MRDSRRSGVYTSSARVCAENHRLAHNDYGGWGHKENVECYAVLGIIDAATRHHRLAGWPPLRFRPSCRRRPLVPRSVEKRPEEQPLNELGTAIEAMKNVPWTTLQELKGDETTLRKLDEAETLLKSLRKALTSE